MIPGKPIPGFLARNVPALETAVEAWKTASQGDAVSVEFSFDGPERELPRLFAELGFAPFSDASRADVQPVYLAKAMDTLFIAASCGGAFGGGKYGAYGRLAAFTSLAAMSGLSEWKDVEQVAAAASACEWYAFATDSAWWRGITGFGLASFRSGGNRVAILSATDEE